jgi:hypothetical protein
MGMPLFSRVRTCVARWPTSHGARQVATSLMVAIALSACGGGPDADETVTTAASLAPKDRPTASTADAPRAGASVAALSNVTPPRGPASVKESAGPYEIRLFDHNDWPRETFELVPVRGVGYQTVHAAVVLRGSKTPSPVAGVQAYCATPQHCEYLPPRNAGHPERYTVSLPDDSVARLSTTEGMIVISARLLEVERPSIVSVTLTVDGQPPVTKRIAYLKSAG